jgi:hypothetical protein
MSKLPKERTSSDIEFLATFFSSITFFKDLLSQTHLESVLLAY